MKNFDSSNTPTNGSQMQEYKNVKIINKAY